MASVRPIRYSSSIDYKKELENGRIIGVNSENDFDSLKKEYLSTTQQEDKRKYTTPQREMWLVIVDDEQTYENRIRIQTVPELLNIDFQTTWAVIPSMGRNTPFLHYTGGEDVVKFELDWYSYSKSNHDVIESCRWVESLCRSDGDNPPPKIMLIWGSIFSQAVWVVDSAPYELRNFQVGKGVTPSQAYQKITLRRVMEIGTNDRAFDNESSAMNKNFTIDPDLDSLNNS